LADARVAAKNAEQAVNDVAAGVKQGLDNKSAPSSRVDLNSASGADLTALPGISAHKAKQIIDHRPYASSHDLVKKGLLTEAQFEEIAPKVTTR
jgi:DNA uptake protein ComE-like DNA-binding protein